MSSSTPVCNYSSADGFSDAWWAPFLALLFFAVRACIHMFTYKHHTGLVTRRQRLKSLKAGMAAYCAAVGGVWGVTGIKACKDFDDNLHTYRVVLTVEAWVTVIDGVFGDALKARVQGFRLKQGNMIHKLDWAGCNNEPVERLEAGFMCGFAWVAWYVVFTMAEYLLALAAFVRVNAEQEEVTARLRIAFSLMLAGILLLIVGLLGVVVVSRVDCMPIEQYIRVIMRVSNFLSLGLAQTLLGSENFAPAVWAGVGWMIDVVSRIIFCDENLPEDVPTNNENQNQEEEDQEGESDSHQ